MMLRQVEGIWRESGMADGISIIKKSAHAKINNIRE